MLLTYYMWIKAVKTGSIYWAAMCALAYFYMVSVPSPGAEVFLTPRTALDTGTKNTWRAVPASSYSGSWNLCEGLGVKIEWMLSSFISIHQNWWVFVQVFINSIEKSGLLAAVTVEGALGESRSRLALPLGESQENQTCRL